MTWVRLSKPAYPLLPSPPIPQVVFMPVAALYGHNIKERIPEGMCDWYTGPTLFEVRGRPSAP